MPTFTASAHTWTGSTGLPELSGFRAIATFGSIAEAEAFAATMPRMLRAKTGESWGGGSEGWTNGGYVSIRVEFSQNRVQGDRNEAGIKRIRRFLQTAYPIEWRAEFKNSVPTLEAFLALL